LNIISRRSRFDLEKAEERNHILEGLLKAISLIDRVIGIIRKSQTAETARKNLMNELDLTGVQAQAILEMPLRRLASLERKKLEDERKELLQKIKYLKSVLSSQEKRLEIVIEETEEIKDKHAEPRRTIIVESEEGHQAAVTVSDMVIPSDTQLVFVSQDGLQRVDSKGYRESVTKGKPSSRAVNISLLREKIEPTETLILVSNKGRCWQGNAGRLPLSGSFTDIGLNRDERIVGIGVAREGAKLVIGTTAGMIKRVEIADVLSSRAEATWATIIGLNGGGEEVLFAGVASDEVHVMICTSGNKKLAPRVLRFEAGTINPQATPSAKGVTAIKMMGDSLVCGILVDQEYQKQGFVYTVTENGHIKRIDINDFPVQGRGGQGVQLWKVSEVTGFVTGFTVGSEKDQVEVYSTKSKRFRIDGKDLPVVTRATKGVDLGNKYVKGDLFGEGEPTAGVVIC
jgi:DNA gyrase subunit A